MKQKFHVAFTLSAALVMGLFITMPARAGDMKDNPKYQAWAKFKVGSSNTTATDIEMGPNKVHVEITRTLISLTDKELVVESVSSVKVMGQDHTQPGTKETIPAQTDNDDLKMTGDKEVEAMGKTFKCKVWEASGKSDAKPDAHAGMGPDMSKKATIYASDQVPGGIVKIETTTHNDKQMTFVLTAMEAK